MKASVLFCIRSFERHFTATWCRRPERKDSFNQEAELQIPDKAKFMQNSMQKLKEGHINGKPLKVFKQLKVEM